MIWLDPSSRPFKDLERTAKSLSNFLHLWIDMQITAEDENRMIKLMARKGKGRLLTKVAATSLQAPKSCLVRDIPDIMSKYAGKKTGRGRRKMRARISHGRDC